MASSLPTLASLGFAPAPSLAPSAAARLVRAVFEPGPALASPIDRSKARLVAALSLVNAVLLGCAAVVMRGALKPPQNTFVPATVLLGALAMLLAYALSRRGELRASTILCVGVEVAIPTVIMLLDVRDPGFDAFENMVWLVLGVFFANALTTPRTTAIVVGSALCSAALGFVLSRPEAREEFIRGSLYLLIATALLFVFGLYRDLVEKARAAELRARNDELEALRRSLEERVAERTAALRASHGDLAEAYGTLQNNQQSMLVAEKMASLGRLTAGIAHEMSSPLSAVRAALADAKQLVEEYTASISDSTVLEEDHRAIALELGEATALADAGAERVASFVRSIRAQTRSLGDRHHVHFDAVAAVRDAMQLLGHAAIQSRVRVVLQIGPKTAGLLGDPGSLAQVVTNLVGNAIDATGELGEGRSVTVSLDASDDELVLRVIDEGPGVAAENLAKIFDPLFTTKAAGKGTGLGLTIVHDIVTSTFGGAIDVSNRAEGGAAFTVRLPRAKEP